MTTIQHSIQVNSEKPADLTPGSPIIFSLFDDKYETHIGNYLETHDHPYLILKGGIESLIDTLSHQPNQPDILVVELDGSDPNSLIKKLDHLAEHVGEKTIVYAFGEINDISFYQNLRSMGISEYFVAPIDHNAFATILSGSQVESQKQKPICIGVVGLSGGVGATSLAFNLTYEISISSSNQVAFIDGQPDHCGLDLLGLNPFQHQEKDRLGAIKINEMFGLFFPYLHSNINSELKTNAETILSVMDQAGADYDIMIVDISSSLIGEINAMNHVFDHFLYVAEPDYKNLTALQRVCEKWNKSQNQHHIALNKIGMDCRIEFSKSEFFKISKCEPFLFYRHDIAAATRNLMNDIPILSKSLLLDQNSFTSFSSWSESNQTRKMNITNDFSIFRI